MKNREENNRKLKRLPENKHILITGIFMGLLFLTMLLYFLWLLCFQKGEILSRSENNRYDSNSSRIIRGSIITSDRAAIAYTEAGEEDQADVRVYPYGSLFSNITGYTAMGKTGLEASCNADLMSCNLPFIKTFRNDLADLRSNGNTVVTTIDSDLQYFCRNLLGDSNGSITITDPKTGKILVMVTNPSYDPNTVKEEWASLTDPSNDTGNLLNRSAQGLYSPGSTFKLVTLIEYMRENPETYRDFSFHCTGEITVGGQTVHCEAGAHGDLDLKHALAQSCNCAFIKMGMTLDREKFASLCKELGFSRKILDELPSSVSTVTINADSSDFEMMQTVFGQGNTMETPLLNCMITAMIANDGVMMKPYIVDHTEDAEGRVLQTKKPEVLSSILSESQAEFLTSCMMACIYEGTSPQAQSDYCTVAGKSGTAQTSAALSDTHAWFTAFFPAEDPVLSVTIMLEKGGHGSPDAAPLVKSIIDYYYSR